MADAARIEGCEKFVTTLPGVAAHANRAVCVLISGDRPLAVWTGGRRFEGEAFLVRPGVDHRVDFGGGEATVLYLWRLIWPEQPGGALRPLSDPQRMRAQRLDIEEPGAAMDFGRSLGLRGADFDSVDPVLREILEDPMSRMSQEDLARRLGCERTNALKRFKAATGLTFRGCKQWCALRAATRDILLGAPIRAAALDAGFADVAHFSRVFRQVNGVTPSAAAATTRLA